MLVRLLVVMDQTIFYRLLHDIFYIAPEIARLITEFATRVAQRVSLVEGTAYLSEAPA